MVSRPKLWEHALASQLLALKEDVCMQRLKWVTTGCKEGDWLACELLLHPAVQGRYVTVLRIDGKLYCIDSICFHAGGPLGIGDIEDVNGHKCLVCPWHFYKIDVQTGDKYYQGVEFKDGKMLGGEWKSNGVRQRVHPVIEQGGKIYVTLSTQPDAEAAAVAAGLLGCGGPSSACSPRSRVDSDTYAFEAPCGDRVLNSPPSANRAKVHSVGADGRKPAAGQLPPRCPRIRSRLSPGPMFGVL
ncbi:hypothetical protein Vretimale_16093 [Volvox reticuliferus]|uniref:Rieske domain-containing protein n=1 Tax=Volvox reticuliferus TaxID=1737510 RepID=A0A8J4GS70_9CHLO|nr:hypothetical protein Vretimale_16093 [Volvox reticuliferus]